MHTDSLTRTPDQPPMVGTYRLANQVILAPMAGVTDRPFRQLCRRLGAAWVVGEMVTSDASLRHTRKTRLRMDHRGEPGPRVIQIAGGDPAMLAEAARHNVMLGAEVIDINMGCPAKKVCNKAAGSALLRDEALVGKILDAVVAAVDVPVTLKIRTGWCETSNNGVRIASMAESAGIKALAVHGRHRQQAYKGHAEYDTIAEIVSRVSIPVFANGDITGPEKAAQVLAYTGAAAIMVGRGAQGNPWIFQQIDHYLKHGVHLAPVPLEERAQVLCKHIEALHDFYGNWMGPKIARKHLGWYLQQDTRFTPSHRAALRQAFNRIDAGNDQLEWIRDLMAENAHDPLVAKGTTVA